MNQYDPDHYYYRHQDPYKFGYWEPDQPLKPTKREFIIGSLTLVFALLAIGSVLFLN